jgi:hypothetical protein
MSTEQFIIALFIKVDDAMRDVPKHPQAAHYPSELPTLALLFVLKGIGERPFYRWLRRDCLPLFPKSPDRTRLFRLFVAHQGGTDRFLAMPTMLGVADTYGIEFIHPWREGRTPDQIGKKGMGNHRWIVGGKVALVLNQWGLVSAWECATANVHDTTFQPLVAQFAEELIVLIDSGFHAADGDPANLKIFHKGEWNERTMVETVLSMLTVVCYCKHMRHRVWRSFRAHPAAMMAAFNVLVRWDGLKPDEHGRIHLAIAQFSLSINSHQWSNSRRLHVPMRHSGRCR